MENPDVTQPTVVTPAGVAKPAAVLPPPPVAANNAAGPPSFEHGYGHPLTLLIRRTLAFLLDTAGIGFVFALFGYDAMKSGRLPIPQDGHGYLELFSLALGAAALLVFISEAIAGTSIGKLLFGLHVRRTSGGRAGVRQIFWRNLFRLIELLIIPVSVIMILVLRHRQRIGDKVSDTTVGRSPMGPFAPVSAMLIVGALSWLVVTYGGGGDTLKGLIAQTQPSAQPMQPSEPSPASQPSSAPTPV